MSANSTTAELLAEAQALAIFIDGPALVGIFMNVMLFGVMLTQTFFYYTTYPNDPRWMKIFVGLIFLADALNTSFNIAWIYGVLITNFGSLNAVLYANWLMETEEAMAGCVACLVQLFYAWRLLKLSGNRYIAGTVAFLAVLQCGAAIGTSITMAMHPLISNFDHYKQAVSLWLSATAFNDLLIAFCLIWYLNRNRTGHSHTESIISRIIQITLSNGLLTASLAFIDFIAYLTSPSALHLAFNYTLCKLYGNSVMTGLNSRAILTQAQAARSAGQVSSTGRGPFDDIVSIGHPHSKTHSRPAQVVIDVERHEMCDVSTESQKSFWGVGADADAKLEV